jgi:hypothetical protein
MTDEETRYSTKVPTFSGKKRDWMVFKTKMESYLAQKGMLALLRWRQAVPTDDEECTAAAQLETPEVQLLKVKVRDENQKAAGILLGCSIIDTDTRKERKLLFTSCHPSSWMKTQDMQVEILSWHGPP